MKYPPFFFALLLCLIACGNPSSPSLKWIGTDNDVGFSEIFFTITDPGLILAFTQNGNLVTVPITLNPDPPGTGAPYTDPQWSLDGEPCIGPFDPAIPSSTPFGNGKPYWISADFLTFKIDTGSLTKGQHEVEVIVTGSDGKHYTDKESVFVDY
jgi:hypothetical protein